jgi:hypothetical protein
MEELRASTGPPIFVAVVAGGRTVDEIRDTRVLVGGRDLLVSGGSVAVDACEGGIVCGDLMAVVADGVVVRNGKVGVFEGGVEPAYGGVAAIAGRWESRSDVIRHEAPERLRAVPIGSVAAIAGCVRRGQGVIVVDVAIGAGFDCGARGGRHLVRTRERPARGAVIELPVSPGNSVMAGGAECGRKSGSNVIGNNAAERLRAVPIGLVATVAIGVGAGEIVVVVDVTERAGRGGMRAGERPTGGAVIEARADPAIEIVAALAIRGGECRAGRGVRRIDGVLPILQVAGIALRREAVEGAGCQLRMALVALHGGVSAKQRKAVLVVFDLLDCNIPALHSVALRAVWAHLAAVNVGVTIGAIFADVCENRLDVALNALHFFVHSAQGIAGFAVIEFRCGFDGTPSSRGVAVFTRNGKWAVRIAGSLLLRSWIGMGRWLRASSRVAGRRKGEQRPESDLENGERRRLPNQDEGECLGETVLSCFGEYRRRKGAQTTVRGASCGPLNSGLVGRNVLRSKYLAGSLRT